MKNIIDIRKSKEDCKKVLDYFFHGENAHISIISVKLNDPEIDGPAITIIANRTDPLVMDNGYTVWISINETGDITQYPSIDHHSFNPFEIVDLFRGLGYDWVKGV